MDPQATAKKPRILVVEEEGQTAHLIRSLLEAQGHSVTVTSSQEEALYLVNGRDIDLILLGTKGDNADGYKVCQRVKADQGLKFIPLILVSANPSLEEKIQGLELGADDYLPKPFHTRELAARVQALLRIKRLQDKLLREEETNEGSDLNFREILGKDPKLQKIYELVEAIAQTDSTVLIQGESGTGKELIARAIHNHSLRRDEPFIVANCAVFPQGLLESELFGHEKGAFTGAIRTKPGKFELAHQGTLFLDEIGEIPPSTQLLLLRVLQERRFERVGGEETIQVDVRVIAATNRDLEEAMEIGEFRDDLYYRLDVIPIHLPPLRERRDDIIFLSHNFLKGFAKDYGKYIGGFSQEALDQLMDYGWPGNIRELENVVERLTILAKTNTIGLEDLPPKIRNNAQPEPAKENSLQSNERTTILKVLQKTDWNKHLAARELGITRSTLYSKLKKHGIVENPKS